MTDDMKTTENQSKNDPTRAAARVDVKRLVRGNFLEDRKIAEVFLEMKRRLQSEPFERREYIEVWLDAAEREIFSI